jgi:hypothetical protein
LFDLWKKVSYVILILYQLIHENIDSFMMEGEPPVTPKKAGFKGKWTKRKFACNVKSRVDQKVSNTPQGDDLCPSK